MSEELHPWRAGVLACVLVLALAAAGCERQSRGFALPPGDAERGREAFTALGCNGCHSVRGSVARLPGRDGATIALGGPTARAKTYGELVTSIIHPSLRISQGTSDATVDAAGNSRMRDVNDRMTVRQLVDITTFLEGAYEVWIPEYPDYRPGR